MYLWHLLHCIRLFSKREGSLPFGSSWGFSLFSCWSLFLCNFPLIWIKRWRTVGVVCSTDSLKKPSFFWAISLQLDWELLGVSFWYIGFYISENMSRPFCKCTHVLKSTFTFWRQSKHWTRQVSKCGYHRGYEFTFDVKESGVRNHPQRGRKEWKKGEREKRMRRISGWLRDFDCRRWELMRRKSLSA